MSDRGWTVGSLQEIPSLLIVRSNFLVVKGAGGGEGKAIGHEVLARWKTGYA